jgi:hypothetical protein
MHNLELLCYDENPDVIAITEINPKHRRQPFRHRGYPTPWKQLAFSLGQLGVAVDWVSMLKIV